MSRSHWMLRRACSRWMGRGTVHPTRSQSHILTVGVAEISRTIESAPEQCTSGDREVVFLAGKALMNSAAGKLSSPREADLSEVTMVRIDASLQTEEDDGVVGGVQQVVALVLGVEHPEGVVDVVG